MNLNELPEDQLEISADDIYRRSNDKHTQTKCA